LRPERCRSSTLALAVVAAYACVSWRCPRANAAGWTWAIVDSGQGPITLSSGDTGATEFSGLAWAGGCRFYAVSDNDGRLFPVNIRVDRATGSILERSVGEGLQLDPAVDLEGIVYRGPGSVLVSDETGSAIREYSLSDGSMIQRLPVPPIFDQARRNKSLESLTAAAGMKALWTANEEALKTDGPLSSFTEGTLVRIQKFDAHFEPVGQWAYRTDPIPGDIGRKGRDREVSGVSELVALPGGGLLALERALGGATFLRIRLYLLDFASATDVSAIPKLDGAYVRPVGKRLLWERNGPHNFEAAALGERLDNGDRSLLLLADDSNGVLPQTLEALRLSRRSVPPGKPNKASPSAQTGPPATPGSAAPAQP
jgi:hypothetical protein